MDLLGHGARAVHVPRALNPAPIFGTEVGHTCPRGEEEIKGFRIDLWDKRRFILAWDELKKNV